MSSFRRDSNGTESRNGRRIPKNRTPNYVYVAALTCTGTVLYTYWYFQDEAPYTRRKRILATVSPRL